MSQITFSQSIEGYLLAIGARHLSAHTVRDYVNTFKKFGAFVGQDMPFENITDKDIEAFFAAQTKVTNKTLLNYYTGLSALWTWAMREHIVHTHIVRDVIPPSISQGSHFERKERNKLVCPTPEAIPHEINSICLLDCHTQHIRVFFHHEVELFCLSH